MKLTIGCWDIQDRIFDPEVQRYLRSGQTGVDVWVLFGGYTEVRERYMADALKAHFGDLFDTFHFMHDYDKWSDSKTPVHYGTIVLVRNGIMRRGEEVWMVRGGESGHITTVIDDTVIMAVHPDDMTSFNVDRAVANAAKKWPAVTVDRSIVLTNYDTGRLGQFVRTPKVVPPSSAKPKRGRILAGKDVATVVSVGYGVRCNGAHHRPVIVSAES